jgi:hypothetical protein
MKAQLFRPALVFCMIALSSLACGVLSGSGSGGGSASGGGSSPTGESAQPTEAPVSKYFQEDFNGGFDNWTHFVVNGKNSTLFDSDPGDMTLGVQNGFLLFDLQGRGEWAYAIYNAQDYDDVRIDVSADNRGTNDNSISMVCRYTPDGGWYEFNIANSGLYNILYAKQTPDNKIQYARIADGGSNKIHQGKTTNQYTAICQGHTLTLYINNIKTRQIDDNDYVLQSGKIGLSVSSFNAPPATVGFDWVKISQP